METRRSVLKTITAAALLPIIRPSAALAIDDLCLHHATQLALALKAKHGGAWKISIDHDFAMVTKIHVPVTKPPAPLALG